MPLDRIAIYTALYGNYDPLQDSVEQDVDVDWICFTDDSEVTSKTWNVVVSPPRLDTPRMSAKFHKMRPSAVLPDHRWAVWIDANVVVDAPEFAREAVTFAERSGTGVTTFAHPQRDCILDESHACSRLSMCEGVPVIAQAEAYLAEGYPRHGGLFGCRCIVWDTHHDGAGELGRQWLNECQRWTFRDQISFPVVARRMGLRPGVFPHHLSRHTPLEAMACWLRQRHWGVVLLDKAFGATPAGPGSGSPRHPVPRRFPLIGNPWFATVSHRLEI